MRGWSLVAAGIAMGLVMASLLGGSTRGEFYARASAGGRYLFDARLDESALGRAINIPAAAFGEASVTKRSWAVFTVYEFTLRLRPGLASDAEPALRGMEVAVRLPGRVTSTNASRAAGGTAVWDTLPAEPLVLRTRSVHGLRLIALAALGAVALLGYRRR